MAKDVYGREFTLTPAKKAEQAKSIAAQKARTAASKKKKPMKPHVPAKVKDPIGKSKHKIKRVPNPGKK